jgi:hypothetical protein
MAGNGSAQEFGNALSMDRELSSRVFTPGFMFPVYGGVKDIAGVHSYPVVFAAVVSGF